MAEWKLSLAVHPDPPGLDWGHAKLCRYHAKNAYIHGYQLWATPSWPLETFTKLLDELNTYLAFLHTLPFLVLGD